MNSRKVLIAFLALNLYLILTQPVQAQWKEVHSGHLEGYNLFDIHKHGDTLVAVGYIADGTNSVFKSVIITSTDNAASWEETYIDGRFMKSMAFNNDGTGYIAGFGLGSTSFIMKSDDGGLTWDDHFIDATTTGCTNVQFFDDDLGFASGYGTLQFGTPSFFETSNGGQTWTNKIVTSPEYTTFDEFSLIDGDCYALSSVYFDGSLLGDELNYSADSGENWIKIYEHTANLGGMAWLSGLKGFLVDENGSIQKSMDGGVNWTQVHKTSDALFDITMNDSIGFVTGAEGSILQTKDNGASWVKQSTPTTKNISGLVILSDRSFALGQDGLILQLDGEIGSGSGGPGEDPDPSTWPVGIDRPQANTLAIYPNPVSLNQIINVVLPAGVKAGEARLINHLGQNVNHWIITQELQTIRLGNVIPGIYTVVLSFDNSGLEQKETLIITP